MNSAGRRPVRFHVSCHPLFIKSHGFLVDLSWRFVVGFCKKVITVVLLSRWVVVVKISIKRSIFKFELRPGILYCSKTNRCECVGNIRRRTEPTGKEVRRGTRG